MLYIRIIITVAIIGLFAYIKQLSVENQSMQESLASTNSSLKFTKAQLTSASIQTAKMLTQLEKLKADYRKEQETTSKLNLLVENLTNQRTATIEKLKNEISSKYSDQDCSFKPVPVEVMRLFNTATNRTSANRDPRNKASANTSTDHLEPNTTDSNNKRG